MELTIKQNKTNKTRYDNETLLASYDTNSEDLALSENEMTNQINFDETDNEQGNVRSVEVNLPFTISEVNGVLQRIGKCPICEVR